MVQVGSGGSPEYPDGCELRAPGQPTSESPEGSRAQEWLPTGWGGGQAESSDLRAFLVGEGFLGRGAHS